MSTKNFVSILTNTYRILKTFLSSVLNIHSVQKTTFFDFVLFIKILELVRTTYYKVVLNCILV